MDGARLPSVLNAFSLVILLASGAYALFAPKPRTEAEIRKARNATQNARLDAKKARDLRDVSEASAKALTWSDGADQIAPKALAVVTREARARSVRLVAFRPQRTVPGSPLTLVPFTLTLEGTYPQVLDFVKAMEIPSNRLAVTLLQIAAADDATSKVTASVGLTAFVRSAEEAARG